MKKYRVEAFIVPVNNKNPTESNQIDDVKIAKKMKDQSFTEPKESEEKNIEEIIEVLRDNPLNKLIDKSVNDEYNSSDLSDIFFEINEHIYDEIVIPEKKVEVNNDQPKTEYTKMFFKVEEPIYDEPFVGNITNLKAMQNANYDVPPSRWTLASSKYRPFGVVAPKIPKRSSSLMSITEDIESFDESLDDVCCHGRKDGCSTKNQRPEDISEEIFRENWIQKLDSLRRLEVLLKDREIALHSRERLLFKKEKELKILERLVKDRMRQVELFAKRCRKTFIAECKSNNERNVESRSSNVCKCGAAPGNWTSASNLEGKASSKTSLDSNDEKFLKNPPNSRTSLTSDRLGSRISSLTFRSRPRQRYRYDDMDSTLSADVGDSSFIKTSEKFDPIIFKKPAAFSRSASERRPKVIHQTTLSRLGSLIEKNEHTLNETEVKVMERISKNILASQDLETKFLNYGAIDGKTQAQNSFHEVANQKRFSYLNLESINKTIKPKFHPADRPISWSEDADDWLKKKRQAYNEANKRIATEKNDKENFDGKTKLNKSAKMVKKKDSHKKFSIFR